MFQVSVDETFSSGHALRGYKGKCENVHGHNYKVRVTLEGPQLEQIARQTGVLPATTLCSRVTGNSRTPDGAEGAGCCWPNKMAEEAALRTNNVTTIDRVHIGDPH